jgi:hypothetical protein
VESELSIIDTNFSKFNISFSLFRHQIYLLGDSNKFSGNKDGDVIVSKQFSEQIDYEGEEEEMDSSMIN